MAKLGMIKSRIQNEIPFNFSKEKYIQDEHIMTEPFRNINRAIRRPKSNHYINPGHSQNLNRYQNHTCMASNQLDHDNLELITAVADSTFLKTIEPVVFCLLSVAWSLSLWLVNTTTWLSSD
jgi:hypothetical protein